MVWEVGWCGRRDGVGGGRWDGSEGEGWARRLGQLVQCVVGAAVVGQQPGAAARGRSHGATVTDGGAYGLWGGAGRWGAVRSSSCGERHGSPPTHAQSGAVLGMLRAVGRSQLRPS